ncbi:MAG: FAD-binding oxidoreductase [Myxococcales bacterium]|nr:FAD-binding oxidoreductase [Myxococcales bacterium]
MTAPLPSLRCPVVRADAGDAYERARYQYATTSRDPSLMSPGAVIYPQPGSADADIAAVLRHAAATGRAVAVRTGGHCYTGTSSTSRDNLQLDMSRAYTEWDYDEATGLVRCGVSRTLLDFKTRLAAHRRADGTPDPLFMPHGQCYAVHLGGHCMTGGVGQLSRAFGMLADHILRADVILPSGERRTLAPDSVDEADRDLFWAMFGGGPGSFAILTHITFKPYRDADYPYARGFRRVIPYDPRFDTKKLERLIELAVEFKDAPQGYDLCISAGSGEIGFLKHRTGLTNRDARMSTFHAPDKPWFVGNRSSPVAGLAVFFQYSNLDGRPDTYDPSWARRLREAVGAGEPGTTLHRWKGRAAAAFSRTPLLPEARNIDDDAVRPISEMLGKLWAFGGVREYSYPYIKNDAIARQQTRPEFPAWAAARMNELFSGRHLGLMASLQIQQFGGADSKVVANGALGATSYQWRDGMVVGLNVFYDPTVRGAHERALAWQQRIDDEGTGSSPGYISPEMYRWFGFPTGPQEMSKVWPAYYAPEAYERCLAIKRRVDPNGVLSATPFAIGYDERGAR